MAIIPCAIESTCSVGNSDSALSQADQEEKIETHSRNAYPQNPRSLIPEERMKEHLL